MKKIKNKFDWNYTDKCWDCKKKGKKGEFSGLFKDGVCDSCRVELYTAVKPTNNPFLTYKLNNKRK